MAADRSGRRIAIEIALITSVIGPTVVLVFNHFFQAQAVETTKASISALTLSDDRIKEIGNSITVVRNLSRTKRVTGFVINGQYVVTTSNVLEPTGGEQRFEVVRRVSSPDSIIDTVSVSLTDATHHILVLKLVGRVDAEPFESRAAELRPLDKVFAVAYGWGDFLSVPEGRIASPSYTFSGRSVIVANLPIELGMAGAPVFDKDGKLIGMITSAIQNSGIVYLTPIVRVTHLLERGGSP